MLMNLRNGIIKISDDLIIHPQYSFEEPEYDGYGAPSQVLAVWGSPSSGKTIMSVKLARYIASQKKNVILVLADMSAPPLPYVCPPSNLEAETSLGNILGAAHVDGNVIRQITDGLGADAYTYEGGKMTAHTDANGNTESCTYDIYGNVASRTDALGNTTEFTYDAAGNVLSVKTPEGITTIYTYDAIGQKIKGTVIGADGQTRTASCTYDGAGNVLTETDTAGNVTSYQYDGMSNITKILYPDGSSESFAYDRAGNMTSQTDRTGLRTDYTYDLKRNVTAVTTAGETTGFEYYPNGKIYKITEPGELEPLL